ncbi:hypothetical protein WJX84_009978 [Apatococcus fuscideae]|uniref:Uncharacterized protein n=1 Tax=Apatococcus fuscideae TaxID=2026836 RepID=A0AAW1TG60_9CHLO
MASLRYRKILVNKEPGISPTLASLRPQLGRRHRALPRGPPSELVPRMGRSFIIRNPGRRYANCVFCTELASTAWKVQQQPHQLQPTG